MLEALAVRLGIEVGALSAPSSHLADVSIELTRVEQQLAAGHVSGALARLWTMTDILPAGVDADLDARLRHLRAKVLLAAGLPRTAIATLEGDDVGQLETDELATLAECHLHLGEVDAAIEVGLRAVDRVTRFQLRTLPAAEAVADVMARALRAAGCLEDADAVWALVKPSRVESASALCETYLIAAAALEQQEHHLEARRHADIARHYLELSRVNGGGQHER